MSNDLDTIKADQRNFEDKTYDEVKYDPSGSDTDEAVQALVTHVNKYDEQEEYEKEE